MALARIVNLPNGPPPVLDYTEMSQAFRPSHADATYDFKYGVRSIQDSPDSIGVLNFPLTGLPLIRNSLKQIGEISSGPQVHIARRCKPLMFQQGVLRTNCIDCLDRTNVAQYCHVLVTLDNQLYALGFIDAPKVDLDSPLAEDLMKIYEAMGDSLALQYGGSVEHNKVSQSQLQITMWNSSMF